MKNTLLQSHAGAPTGSEDNHTPQEQSGLKEANLAQLDLSRIDWTHFCVGYLRKFLETVAFCFSFLFE